MGRTLQEILIARDTLIFLLQHLGFVINLKKSVFYPVKQIRFLGLIIAIEKMTSALSEKKLKHVSQQCQEIFKQPKTSVLNLAKLVGLLSSSYFTSTNPVSISPIGTNISLTKRGYTVPMWHLARNELLWWMGNLKISNATKNQQREPHMIIQTDAWTNVRRNTVTEFRQGEYGKRTKSIFA